MAEGIIYRYRCGIAWRNVPAVFGRLANNLDLAPPPGRPGRLGCGAGPAAGHPRTRPGKINWAISVDSTIARAHQRATTITRHAGGWIELHETRDRAARPPRSTGWPTATAAPWSPGSPPGRPETRRCSNRSWPTCRSPGWATADPHPTRPRARRRGLLLPRHPPTPAPPRNSRDHPRTRRPDRARQNAAVLAADAHPPSTPTTTAAATSSNASTNSPPATAPPRCARRSAPRGCPAPGPGRCAPRRPGRRCSRRGRVPPARRSGPPGRGPR